MTKNLPLITPRPRSLPDGRQAGAKRGRRYSSLTLKAPAKINWFLHVGKLRDDGYHEIKSLIQKIGLYDNLVFKSSKNLILTTNSEISFKQNLVYKAALILKKQYKVTMGAEIHLDKNIPVAAGLGGGSSDAASTLLGLNELWSLRLSKRELCELAEQLGSDVPFFLHGPLSFVTGRGEKITSLKSAKKYNLLLVKPPIGISTKWAYGQLRNRCKMQDIRYKTNPPLRVMTFPPFTKGGRGGINSELRTQYSELSELTKNINKVDNIKLFLNKIEKGSFLGADNTFNTLESMVIRKFPEIENIKDRLFKEGAIFSVMSGSGPTVFGVFSSAKKAKIPLKAFSDCWTAVVKTIVD